jgi:hypothetical protein
MNTKQYVIVDCSTNTNKIYISEDNSNCELIENAKIYNTQGEAFNIIIKNGWSDWAIIEVIEGGII